MKNLKILLLLVSFIFCHAYSAAAADEYFDASTRWRDCAKYPYLVNKVVHFAYLSKTYVNQFHWKIPPPENLQSNDVYYSLPEDQPLAPHLLSICLCRNSVVEALFFMMPYANSTGDDVIAVCVVGQDNENFTSIGVYDDEELYDLLILKHQELIPASVIDPVEIEVEHTCLDLYRKSAKDVMNQKTCIISATVTSTNRSLYSGPLMSKELVNFESDEILKYCFTTVTDTIKQNTFQDYCFIQNTFNGSKLVCCCPDFQFICLPRTRVLYCLAGNVNKNNQMEKISALEYTKQYFEPACTLTVTAKYSHEEFIELSLLYGARSGQCPEEDEIEILSPSENGEPFKESSEESSSTTTTQRTSDVESFSTTAAQTTTKSKTDPIKFCSDNRYNDDIKFSITYCCSNTNLCNYDLIPQKLKVTGETKIKFDKYACNRNVRPALFEYLFPGCKVYRSLRVNTILLHLYEGFNAKIYDETRQKLDEVVSFAIAKIIKADDSDCSNRVILEKDVFIPISITNDSNAAYPSLWKNNFLKKYQRNFTCLNSTGQYNVKSDTWFCFIQINSEPSSLSSINIAAGHLEIKEYSECYFGNVLNESFCCINVFTEKQSESNCTIEKLTKAYKEHVKVKNEINRIISGEPTQCIRREFVDDRECPGTDGCFDIRNLESPATSSTTTITDVTEVAGCLGYAEEYTLKDFPMASLSIHCRLNENANKCSIVHGPDGLQHVLCCCNQNGENDNCRKQSDELSKQIGKHVSSFKELDA